MKTLKTALHTGALLAAGIFGACAETRIQVGATTYAPYRTDLTNGAYVYVDADPAANSPVRATQRSLGYREVDYKSVLPGTLFFNPVLPATNGATVTFDYTAQGNKTNLVGFWVAKDVPIVIGPDGLAYITDGHHTTAGYLVPGSPVREVVPGLNRVIMGHVVANYFNPTLGPVPADDAWWTARAAENNALLYGPEGDLLILPGEPNFDSLQPILPSVQPTPTTPSNLTTNGAVAMAPSLYRALTWGLADGIIVSATDGAGKKIAGYKKAPPQGGADINFVEFYWSDYLRDRIVWDDSRPGSPLGSTNTDANAIAAPVSFLTAVANGIGLAKSERYHDRHGRNIAAYRDPNLFNPTTVFWAGASLSNGLAQSTDTFHYYLRDDSSISGPLEVSARSTNILHIDTVSGMVLTQSLANVNQVVINGGGMLKTSWKDTTVSNTTVLLPAGTGVVQMDQSLAVGRLTVAGGTFTGSGSVEGEMVVQAGQFIPGNGLGRFTVHGPLTLGGHTVIEVRKTGSVITNDTLQGVSTLTYQGHLELAATGDSFTAGDVVKIFDATNYIGFFYNGFTLPNLVHGLGWDTSGLRIDGSLRVVSKADNLPPSVVLSGPTNVTLSAPARVSLKVTGTDPENALAKIEIFDGATRVATSTSGDFILTLPTVAAGVHTYTALATDHLGQAASSTSVNVTVTTSNSPPVISFSSPGMGVELFAPATFAMEVSASDADGDIARVDYYRGTTKIGSAQVPPFSAWVTNFPLGTWTLQAVGIDSNGATNSAQTTFTVKRAASSSAFALQILHASDFEAGIQAVEDAVRFSQVLAGLREDYPTNTLILSSGDNYIPGPFFNASSDPAAPFSGIQGRGDIVILNALGVQASCFGNHEFDNNTPQVRSLILPDATVNYPGTQFPYLSANLDFSTDSNLASLVTVGGKEAALLKNRIARSAILNVGGQTVGLVGGTTTDLRLISSPGNVGVNTNLVGTIQAAIDDLLAQGVNKIIVLAHLQQFANEFDLAQHLHDVDVLLAGGSHSVFAKPGDRLREGDVADAVYPTTFHTTAQEPVLVVNTGPNYRYVGRLVVAFDTNGVVTAIDPASGPYPTDLQGVAATGNHDPIPAVLNVVTNLGGIIDTKDSVRFGRTTEYLNGLRGAVRTEESNLGDLTADANLWRARQRDATTVVSIKNGGGIRDSIGSIASVGGSVLRIPPVANPRVGKQDGEISQLDIENSLRFNNGLSLISLTAQQLRDVFEWGVAAAATGATPGQFPQSSGVAFSFNATNAPMVYARNSNNVPTGIAQPGSRLRSLVVTNANGTLDLVVENGRVVGDASRRFRVVTLDFMASGGDTYYPFTLGTERLDLIASSVTNRTFLTDGSEQKALADYLQIIGTVTLPDTAVALDKREQNLSARTDSITLPLLTRILPGTAGWEIYFQTLPGKNYKLQSHESLAEGWLETGYQAQGDGSVQILRDTRGASGQRFYRLERTN